MLAGNVLTRRTAPSEAIAEGRSDNLKVTLCQSKAHGKLRECSVIEAAGLMLIVSQCMSSVVIVVGVDRYGVKHATLAGLVHRSAAAAETLILFLHQRKSETF